MPGSTSRWDQHEDPRDHTVDLPRIDVDGLTDYFRRAAPMLEPEPGGVLEPLPEEKPARRIAPPPADDPGRGSHYPSQSRGYGVPGTARLNEQIGHPYAEPDALGRPSAWRAVQAPPAAVEASSQSSYHATPNSSGEQPGEAAPLPAAALPAVPQATAGLAEEPQAAAVLAEEPQAADNEFAGEHHAGRAAEVTAAGPGVAVPPAEPSMSTAEPSMPTAEATEPIPRSAPSAEPAARTSAPGRPTAITTGRAAAGSRADLRSRLAQLPDGHPSSPYDDDGRAKPRPIRLKQLELGLPAPTREFAADSVPDGELADFRPGLAPDSAGPGLREPADRTRGQAEAVPGVGEPDKAQVSSADVLAPEALAADDTGAESDRDAALLSGTRLARPEPAGPPARPENGTVARDGDTPRPPEDLTLGLWRARPSPRDGDPDDLSAGGGNGHGPKNGRGATSGQRESLVGPDRPDRARGVDRRDTGQGHLTGPSAQRQLGERPTQRQLSERPTQRQPSEPPSAELRQLAERTLATCRTAEGRNAVGSYGSSGLTPAMQRLAAHLPFGGLAPGSEANSLKSLERLTAKLTRLIARNPGRTAQELAAAIGDVVRYAFAFEAADYMEGTWLVHRRLKSHGFELEIRRNRWESPEHKGIFTQWRDPAHQVAFEVQFHTTASWAVIQQTHDAYVQITDPATSPAERARLRARQITAAAKATPPHNWAEFDDFRLEAR